MNNTEKAIQSLESGGIVIFPTETVFGIGCLLKFPESIKKLYKIKQRDSSKPTLLLVKDLEASKKLVLFNKLAVRLADSFWPGPLTICLPAAKPVPEEVLGPDNTLALRVPDNDWLLSLLKAVDEPILGPSANLQGENPASKSDQIDKELVKLVDYVVDVEPGGSMPSTIVSFVNDKDYKILREGPITTEQIKQVLATS